MPEAIVEVTAGSGTKLHSWSRTIGSNTVHDEFTLPGEFPYASYVVTVAGVSIGTATDHLLQIMAGASLSVRIRRIRIDQLANAGAAALGQFEVRRLTSAGTGGTSATPARYDNTDPAAGATAMTIPTAKGTESTALFRETVTMRSAAQSTAEDSAEWQQHPSMKALVIPAGTSNGICIKNVTAIATATIIIRVEFSEQDF